jgi:hydrogenase expression/formation protein HypC
MCLGIPGKVVRTFHEHDVLMGKVDFGGVTKQVCLEHVRDVRIGQYVLVHVGFALSMIDEAEARLVFEFLCKMKQLDELSVESPGDSDAPSPPLPQSMSQSGGEKWRAAP